MICYGKVFHLIYLVFLKKSIRSHIYNRGNIFSMLYIIEPFCHLFVLLDKYFIDTDYIHLCVYINKKTDGYKNLIFGTKDQRKIRDLFPLEDKLVFV